MYGKKVRCRVCTNHTLCFWFRHLTVWDRSSAAAGFNEADHFLCYVTVPACALRCGYRNVPMRDANGCKIAFCKMVCNEHARDWRENPMTSLVLMLNTVSSA